MEQLTIFNKKSSEKIKIRLTLFEFKEDSNFILYSPSLDISGYGKTVAAAKKSFDITIQETISYCYKNNTLSALLTSLGWYKGIGANSIYKSPSLASKINTNEYLQDVLNKHEQVTLKNNVELSIA